jgi:hypothetical protein
VHRNAQLIIVLHEGRLSIFDYGTGMAMMTMTMMMMVM